MMKSRRIAIVALSVLLCAALGLAGTGCAKKEADADAAPKRAVVVPDYPIPTVTCAEAWDAAQADPSVVILDVRTPEEYAAGHVVGAITFDYYLDDFDENLETLDKDATYYVYCRCGKRGAASVDMMMKMGFTSVYNIDEGWLEWRYQRLPVEY